MRTNWATVDMDFMHIFVPINLMDDVNIVIDFIELQIRPVGIATRHYCP